MLNRIIGIHKDKDKNTIINKTIKWVQDFVIGLNLCPFAGHPFRENQIRYISVDFENGKDFIDTVFEEVKLLMKSKPEDISTTLVIIADGLQDFLFYLDILETCQDFLDRSGLDEFIQMASFHPHYQFEGTEKDDVTNYTNRSPYPIIHLLRVSDLEKAIKTHGHTDEIPIANQKLLREMGIDKVKKLASIDK